MRFPKKTADGQKTPKMLEVEKRLGRTLEEDYHEHYLNQGWGQTRLAKRWGVKRNLIFYATHGGRAGRRSWVEMLKLPGRTPQRQPVALQSADKGCEACGENSATLERAHWVPAKDDGSTTYNIAMLCPNCHTKLDQLEDPETTEKVRGALLLRSAKSLLQKECSATEFLAICARIINTRRRKER